MPSQAYDLLYTGYPQGNFSITFSNIPQTYRDIVVVAEYYLYSQFSQNYFFNTPVASRVTFNGNTSSYFTSRVEAGSAISAGDSSSNSPNIPLGTGSLTTMSHIINIMDYSMTDRAKRCYRTSGYYNGTTSGVYYDQWNNSSAISSMTFSVGVDWDGVPGYFASGSFSLYGIKA